MTSSRECTMRIADNERTRNLETENEFMTLDSFLPRQPARCYVCFLTLYWHFCRRRFLYFRVSLRYLHRLRPCCRRVYAVVVHCTHSASAKPSSIVCRFIHMQGCWFHFNLFLTFSHFFHFTPVRLAFPAHVFLSFCELPNTLHVFTRYLSTSLIHLFSIVYT